VSFELDTWSALPIVGAVLAVILVRLARRGSPLGHLVAVTVFAAYLTGVAAATVFPLVVDPEFIEVMRRSSIWDGVNLVPFRLLGVGHDGSRQVLLNIILGMPFGFLLPFLRVRSDHAVLGWGAVFVVGIEGVQLLIDIAYGFAYRSVDINDVMLNFLGVVCGLAIFRVLARLYRSLDVTVVRQSPYVHGVLEAG
jgi:glycopeptide antibiotics resistance protein